MVTSPPFVPGETVRLRVDPERVGAVLTGAPGPDGIWRFLVFHGPGDAREYEADQLVAAERPAGGDSLLDALAAGMFVAPAEYRARITAAGLAHPVADNLYAMRAARIQHVPFQYKPLLRLLRADRPRLLIADDVGVGKTIEAGLILKELSARHDIGNVAIVCPKVLASKWHAEMRRFDEQFKIMSAGDLRHAIRDTQAQGLWPHDLDRVILPLELIQREDYRLGDPDQGRPGLATLDEPPRFGLLIVDEAHHLRNPTTGRHASAEFLCDVSDAVIFLSATPVHVGARNLFTLLALLRPDMFPDMETFTRMVEPNRHITQSMRLVRAGFSTSDTWQREAFGELELAARTPWGQTALRRNPHFQVWHQRLAHDAPMENEDRVRCLRDLEEAHTLALVMNRTRRRDVGRFTQRDPHTVHVAFTPAQEAFYARLVDWRLRLLRTVYNPLVAHLVLTTVERQAASCLATVGDGLAAMLATGRLVRGAITDDAGDDIDVDLEEVEIPADLLEEAGTLLREARSLPPDDPKLDALLEITRATMDDIESPGKVLVFSFFLATLGYLKARLLEAGVRVEIVSGNVAEDDRQVLRDRFRLPRTDPAAIDVLLSSEVGCEGLDYEFCDRLVNYDIPWNPMRVEQRIGRIDRFGQKAAKVLIFNLVTPGTIEDRVFFRCFERLGIFRDTVGDLEEVLGDTVSSLTRLVVDTTLSPAQVDERARQEADNVVRRADEQRRLESQSADLLGLDLELQDEAEEITRRQKYVTAGEVLTMVGGYLERAYGEARLAPDTADARLMRLRLTREQRAELRDAVRALGRRERPVAEFLTVIDRDPIEFTFDDALAMERRDLPFVTPMHPLARLARAYWSAVTGPLTAQLASTDPTLPGGRYVFALERWEVIAARPEIRLMPFVIALDDARPAPEVADRLLDVIRDADAVPERAPVPVGEHVRMALDAEAQRIRRDEVVRLKAANESLVDQRVASIDSYYLARLDRLRGELADASDPRISRMKRSQHDQVDAEFRSRRAEAERRRDADIVPTRISVGILEIAATP